MNVTAVNVTTGPLHFSVVRPEPLSNWAFVTLWSVMIFLSVITVAGNILVVWAYHLDGSLRKSLGNRFIISLAISDCIIGFEGYPFFTVFVANGEIWTLGNAVCMLWLFLDYSLCLVSILTVLLITTDRFLSVCHTARYIKWQTPERMNMVIAFSWVLPALFFGFMIFGWEMMTGEVVETDKCYAPFLQNQWVNMIMYFTYYWSTLIAMFVLYTGIHKKSRELQNKARARQNRTIGLLMGQRLGAQVAVKLYQHKLEAENVVGESKRRSVSSVVPPTSPFFDANQLDNHNNKSGIVTNVEVTNNKHDYDCNELPQNASFKDVLSESRGTLDHLERDHQSEAENDDLMSLNGDNNDNASLVTCDSTPHSVSVSFYGSDSFSLRSGFRDHSFASVLNLADGSVWPLAHSLRPSQRSKRNRRTSLRRSLQQKRVICQAMQASNHKTGVHSPIRRLITHSRSFQPTMHRQGTLESISSDEEFSEHPPHTPPPCQHRSVSLRSPKKTPKHNHLLSTEPPSLPSLSSLDPMPSGMARLAQSEQSLDLTSSICTAIEVHQPETALIHNHITRELPAQNTATKQESLNYESNDTTITKTQATNDSIEANRLVPPHGVRKGIRHSVRKIVRHVRHRPSWDQTSTDEDESDGEPKERGHGEAIVNLPADTAGGTATSVMQTLFKPINILRRRRKTKAERRAHKAFRTITFIVGFFAALWSPYFIVATIYGFCAGCVHPVLFIVCYYLCYVNSAGNPFMYALANQQFKLAFIRIFRGQWHRT